MQSKHNFFCSLPIERILECLSNLSLQQLNNGGRPWVNHYINNLAQTSLFTNKGAEYSAFRNEYLKRCTITDNLDWEHVSSFPTNEMLYSALKTFNVPNNPLFYVQRVLYWLSVIIHRNQTGNIDFALEISLHFHNEFENLFKRNVHLALIKLSAYGESLSLNQKIRILSIVLDQKNQYDDSELELVKQYLTLLAPTLPDLNRNQIVLTAFKRLTLQGPHDKKYFKLPLLIVTTFYNWLNNSQKEKAVAIILRKLHYTEHELVKYALINLHALVKTIIFSKSEWAKTTINSIIERVINSILGNVKHYEFELIKYTFPILTTLIKELNNKQIERIIEISLNSTNDFKDNVLLFLQRVNYLNPQFLIQSAILERLKENINNPQLSKNSFPLTIHAIKILKIFNEPFELNKDLLNIDKLIENQVAVYPYLEVVLENLNLDRINSFIQKLIKFSCTKTITQAHIQMIALLFSKLDNEIINSYFNNHTKAPIFYLAYKSFKLTDNNYAIIGNWIHETANNWSDKQVIDESEATLFINISSGYYNKLTHKVQQLCFDILLNKLLLNSGIVIFYQALEALTSNFHHFNKQQREQFLELLINQCSLSIDHFSYTLRSIALLGKQLNSSECSDLLIKLKTFMDSPVTIIRQWTLAAQISLVLNSKLVPDSPVILQLKNKKSHYLESQTINFFIYQYSLIYPLIYLLKNNNKIGLDTHIRL
ncbi:MAG TPA: hypothetical protein PK657_08045 [Legionella sp.]|nr:hypothetical protein [Legionella sp.]